MLLCLPARHARHRDDAVLEGYRVVLALLRVDVEDARRLHRERGSLVVARQDRKISMLALSFTSVLKTRLRSSTFTADLKICGALI